MIKITKCKKCGTKNVYKDGFCYKHFKEWREKYNSAYRKKNIEKIRKYDRERYYIGKVRKCKNCGCEFTRNDRHLGRGFCSKQCAYEFWKKNNERKAKKNPAYRNGFYVNRSKTKMSKVAITHYNACRKFRHNFLEENNYLYCEHCHTNNSLRFETHHIVFASEAPKHKELHNHRNLILLCIKCHNDFHGKKREMRKNIVIERDLEKLFDKQLYDREK